MCYRSRPPQNNSEKFGRGRRLTPLLRSSAGTAALGCVEAICTAGGGCATSSCCRASSSRHFALDSLPLIGWLVLQLHSSAPRQLNCRTWGGSTTATPTPVGQAFLPARDRQECLPHQSFGLYSLLAAGQVGVRVRPTAHAALRGSYLLLSCNPCNESYSLGFASFVLVLYSVVGAAVVLPHLGWQYNCHPNRISCLLRRPRH